MLAKRAAVLGEYAASDAPPDPDELLTRLIAAIDPAEARVGVQTWGRRPPTRSSAASSST
ncbi:hypothetical protein ACFQ10_48635 [Streptomyces indonesiensis]